MGMGSVIIHDLCIIINYISILLDVVSMAFVINVIKWLLWTADTRNLYRPTVLGRDHYGRDYVLSEIYYSVLVRNTCQHSQQTRH